MKTNHPSQKLSGIFNVMAYIFFGTLIGGFNHRAQADGFQNITNGVTPDEIIASTHFNDYIFERFENVAIKFDSEQTQLKAALLSELKDSNTSKFGQWRTAYYLGELHASETTEALAAKIKLQFSDFQVLEIHLPSNLTGNYTARDALIKIGTPSIPAVVRNLAESDDAKVRELSLQVICRIEGDKDIVQLRLQKALAAEKDLQKHTRLQAALTALAGISL